MKTRISCAFILLLFGAITAFAQPSCRVRTFTIRDGLAANTISGFCQTSNDMMWFSTWNGLSCFDGYSFTTFRDDRDDEDMLTSNRLLMVHPDSRDNLWCVAYDRHLYLFDTYKCQYVDVGDMLEKKYGKPIKTRTIYNLPNGHTWVATLDNGPAFCLTDSLIGDEVSIKLYDIQKDFKGTTVHKVVLDTANREWIFTDKGATMIAPDGTRFATTVRYDNLVSLSNTVALASPDGIIALWEKGWKSERRLTMPEGVSAISNMLAIDDYRVVAASDAGLIVVDVSGKEQPKLIGNKGVKEVYLDNKSRLWVFTNEDGVDMVDTRDWQITHFSNGLFKPLLATVSESPLFHQDQNGTVWLIPTNGAFCYYDELSRQLMPYILQTPGFITTSMLLSENTSTDLPSVSRFLSDSQHNLWFTGTRALTMLSFTYPRYTFSNVVPNQEGRAVCADGKGNTWIGMFTGEVAVSDTTGTVRYLNKQGTLQSSPVTFSNRVYAIFKDRKGRMWIGTKGEGLFVLDTDGRLSHYSKADGGESINDDAIYGFDEDSHGRVWIATYGGGVNIAEEKEGKQIFQHPFAGVKDIPMQIRRITHDKGVMLISSNSGLITMSEDWREGQPLRWFISTYKQGNKEGLLTSDVMQVLVLSNGKRFVITQSGGVQEIIDQDLLHNDLRMRRIEAFDAYNSLPLSLAEDKSGNVWMVREGGIDSYNTKTGVVESFGPHELGDNIRFSEALPAFDTKTGKLSFAVIGGAITIQPDEMHKSDFKPNIVFTGVQYQGEETIIPILNKNIIEVASNHRNLTIYFSALDYNGNDQVEYAYKIEGRDKDWNYVGNTHGASFNHLPHGTLRLLVKSTNSEGVWMDNETVLEIYSEPTFWESWYAWLLYISIMAGLVALAVYIYRLHTRNKMEREVNDMKTRFFTDVSHKLRTPLTLIGGPVTEVLDREQDMTQESRGLLEMVRRNSNRMLALVNRMLTYSREHEVYISDDNVDTTDAAGDMETIESIDATGNIKLLIVEDNDDLRAFLYSILRGSYHVIQAANGKQGLEMAERELPDFIITDVMMPEMDGLTMVRHIKNNTEICHIPIIVLSAKASMEDRLAGLRAGIDDYITKPFSATYLKQRVENIVESRKLLQQSLLANVNVNVETGGSSEDLPAEGSNDGNVYKLEAPQIVDTDKKMMEKLMEYLNQHIGEAELRIEDLADAVGMGRTSFYSKLKTIVGMTPVDFVRHIRIQRAEYLIIHSNDTFSQVAYAVGFSDPKYFSRCFKKETGMTPSEYKKIKT